MIWKLIWNMRAGPEVVHMDFQESSTPGKIKMVVTRPQTVLTYINRESRASTGLSKLDLSSSRKPWYPITMPKQLIFVDFQRDTFVMTPMGIHCLKLKDLAKIRNAEVAWVAQQSFWWQSFVSNKRSFLACTGLERLTFRISTPFLGDVVITSEEPDWAEQYAALHPPVAHSLPPGTVAGRLKRAWDKNLRVLRESLEGFRKHHPAWVPPKIILKFSADLYGFPLYEPRRFWWMRCQRG